MLPTADVLDSVIFDSDITGAFADGCVWVQMGTIGVEATVRVRDRLAAQRCGVGSDRGDRRGAPGVRRPRP
ncbi:hypothetical protein Vau01_018660 [Virgisporangium aurantiacum]|uniref:Uncharacterized protein n=2 Tax=Virgisporangium aurantiacum TaxID=175570 RepID=A0A8J3Z3J0_9ACTN|nr:hypothetical protein Vau01_018660 [Virgisporangium aurantiacum]